MKTLFSTLIWLLSYFYLTKINILSDVTYFSNKGNVQAQLVHLKDKWDALHDLVSFVSFVQCSAKNTHGGVFFIVKLKVEVYNFT